MSSTKLLFNLFCLLPSLLYLQVESSCVNHDTELLCTPLDFSVYNISLFNFNTSSSIQTIHLTNSFYSGFLAETINKLIIDGYPYEAFGTTFNSTFTLSSLLIEHTRLSVFPPWLCTLNKNLSFIEIDNSNIERILEHDLNLCFHLKVLRIINSHLQQFTNHVLSSVFLQYLYLNNNNFTEISSENGLNLNQFPSLVVLDLSFNQIEQIFSGNFNQTPHLTKLYLSNNTLHFVQLNQSLISLELLDFEGNHFLQIDKQWYNYLPHLTRIRFPYAHFCCAFKNVQRPSNYKRIDDNKNYLPILSPSSSVCSPLPDPMTPCEPFFSSKFTRFVFLIIVCVSFSSNLTALIIRIFPFLASPCNRSSISTLFSSNLVLADFISSIYLILIAIVDTHFKEDFSSYTQIWTKSYACGFAGFTYTFGIQSSIYALTLLTFERFYTILFSFTRQTPWRLKFTLTVISIGWFVSFITASLPLMNVNNFHANSLCIPFRMEYLSDRLYLSVLIFINLVLLGIIIICNGLICFNFSKSHVRTLNDARATVKILSLVFAVCISHMPLIIYVLLALFTYSKVSNVSGLRLNDIKLTVLFLQPFNSCFNPFMYSSLSTFQWTSPTRTTTMEFERPKPVRKSHSFSQFRSKSVVFNRGYHPLRLMSISSLDYRSSSLPDTP
ncbi:unnamed protein product [Adineta ricciae]|uniref:G-protein coupled receptors family 1 profile domain-containing protein n=1 Tax=Adineta ricciae TaxID=249248 RepID=A0A815SMK1_ADIRI|nr:unnamed protein product [Adineta ricciae]